MNNKQIRRVFSRIGIGMFLFLLIPNTVILGLDSLCSQYVPQILNTGWYYWVRSYGALYLMAFPVLIMVLSTIPSEPEELFCRTSLSFKQLAQLSMIAFGIMYPLSFITVLLNEFIASLAGINSSNPLTDALLQSNPWLTLFISIIVAPIMEELIFRGILYKKLICFGGKIYIFVSAFLFALFHTNFLQIFYAFALGLLLGAVVYYTGHLRYCIILHMIINLVGSGVATLLLHYGLDMLLIPWGIVIIGLMFAGFACAIKWWERYKQFYFAPPVIFVESKSVVFLNLGMLLFIILAFMLTVIVFIL